MRGVRSRHGKGKVLARSTPASLRWGMQTLALWVLVTYGANLAITTSKIFAPVRAWIAVRSTFLGTLVRCPMCAGFWIGFAWPALGVESAFVSMTVAWVIHVVLARLGAKEL